MSFQLSSLSQPDMARAAGQFQAEPGCRLMAQRITSGPIRLATLDQADQAILVRKRCAAIRLLASACHRATALTLIRPRTGRKPNPWFLRLALIRSMSLR